MNEGTLRLSRDLRKIAEVIDDMIYVTAGEKVAFALVVFTEGRASYCSTAARDVTIGELEKMIQALKDEQPPAHEVQ